MKKSWHLLEKILSGEKTAESRWYKSKRSPWGVIHAGDILWFKDSGEPVTAKARVVRVLQFDNLSPEKTNRILKKYGRQDLGIADYQNLSNELKEYFKNKKYCLIIFFDQVKKVKPFKIDKTGFGAMSAWVSVNDIKKIKA